jgi:hypothetical protein
MAGFVKGEVVVIPFRKSLAATFGGVLFLNSYKSHKFSQIMAQTCVCAPFGQTII